jgi:hypothetical protein
MSLSTVKVVVVDVHDTMIQIIVIPKKPMVMQNAMLTPFLPSFLPWDFLLAK